METTINRRRNRALILLILLPLTATGVARWSMSSGIGVTPDSVIYLSTADSVLAGRGFTPIAFHFTPTIAPGKPLVAFPPTYPLLLSLSGMLSTDRLNGARWLHSLLFAVNIFLVGMIVYLASGRSALAASGGMLLFLSSAPLLEIHTMAWSEPAFILFLLLAFLFLMLYSSTRHYLFLVTASLAASLAMTTRYAGVTILPPLVITVLLENRPLRNRIRDVGILLGIALVPLTVWLLRNVITADSATTRSFAFHPVSFSNLNELANALLRFWLPFTSNAWLKVVSLFLFGGLVAAAIVLALKDRARRDPDENTSVAIQFAAIFIITYVLFLLAYNSLMSPPVELDARTVSPAHVFAIPLIVLVADRFCKFGNRHGLRWGVLTLFVVLMIGSGARASLFAIRRHDNAIGYTSREWAQSRTIEYSRTLAGGTTVYSNGIDAIHFLTKNEARRIPARFDPTTGKANPDFAGEIEALRNELLQNRGVLVFLDQVTWRRYLPAKDELENVYKLPVLIRLDDGVVYGNR